MNDNGKPEFEPADHLAKERAEKAAKFRFGLLVFVMVAVAAWKIFQ